MCDEFTKTIQYCQFILFRSGKSGTGCVMVRFFTRMNSKQFLMASMLAFLFSPPISTVALAEHGEISRFVGRKLQYSVLNPIKMYNYFLINEDKEFILNHTVNSELIEKNDVFIVFLKKFEDAIKIVPFGESFSNIKTTKNKVVHFSTVNFKITGEKRSILYILFKLDGYRVNYKCLSIYTLNNIKKIDHAYESQSAYECLSKK